MGWGSDEASRNGNDSHHNSEPVSEGESSELSPLPRDLNRRRKEDGLLEEGDDLSRVVREVRKVYLNVVAVDEMSEL